MSFIKKFRNIRNNKKIVLKNEEQDLKDKEIRVEDYIQTNKEEVEEPKKDEENISPEIISKIKEKNELISITDSLLKKMKENPKLVDLLLEGNVDFSILFCLSYGEKLKYLPDKVENLKFLKYIEIDSGIKPLIDLLDNVVDESSISDSLFECKIDLGEDINSITYENKIKSFFSDVKINFGSETLTPEKGYCNYIVFLPKSRNKVVIRNSKRFINGEIILDENTIIMIRYEDLRYLSDDVINKISKCKVLLTNKEIEYPEYERENLNYKLIKINHLIYVIENSSIDKKAKDKLIYKIKEIYFDERRFNSILEIGELIESYIYLFDNDEIVKLTKEFELNITYYNNKPIEKNEFNIDYYIEDNIGDIETASIDDVTNLINKAPTDIKIQLLKKEKILKKLGISQALSDKEISNLIYRLSHKLSPTVEEYVSQFDFDVNDFITDPNNDYKSTYKINPIVSRYGMFDSKEEKKVISIADILGHDGMINCGRYEGDNILYTFPNFFVKDGDGYHTRSLGLLEYKSGEELLKELSRRNNDTKDMKITEVENGKYIVDGNGLHRFSVLRFLYLLDMTQKKKSEEEIREMYKIPVTLTNTVNYVRTYCNYLLNKTNNSIRWITEDYEDKEKICIYYSGRKECIKVTEEELLKMTVDSVDKINDFELLEIRENYNNIESFRNFVDTYVPRLRERIIINMDEGLKND